MTSRAVSEEPFEQKDYGYLGGRGLTARTLCDECDPECDALGSENVLVFATGFFALTALSSCNRLSIGAKSPLTGGIKESNAGGTLARTIAQHGIKRIIINGAASDGLYILLFDEDGRCSLLGADEYHGMRNYDFCDAMRARFGEGAAVASVGIAGERGALVATVQVTEFKTGFPCRAAARGGLGAVMGKKGLKAIVALPPKKARTVRLSPDDAAEFARLNKIVSAAILANPVTAEMPKSGTAAGVDVTGTMGALPVDNFSGRRTERWPELGSESWTKNLTDNGGHGGVPCQAGCIVRCSNKYHDKKHSFVTAGIEYETLGLCGSNLGIFESDAIARLDRLCDDLGLDTIDIGAALGVTMESGKLAFGDAEGAISLLESACDEGASPLQKALRDGCAATGDFLGAARVPTAKRQAMAAYDPRVIKGYGMCFERSPMGADHTSGSALTFRKDLSPEQQADLALAQTCAFDNFTCLFPWSAINYCPEARVALCQMAGLLSAEPQTDASLIDKLGFETLELERGFNRAAGLTEKDDRLADFFYTEPAEATGAAYESPFGEKA